MPPPSIAELELAQRTTVLSEDLILDFAGFLCCGIFRFRSSCICVWGRWKGIFRKQLCVVQPIISKRPSQRLQLDFLEKARSLLSQSSENPYSLYYKLPKPSKSVRGSVVDLVNYQILGGEGWSLLLLREISELRTHKITMRSVFLRSYRFNFVFSKKHLIDFSGLFFSSSKFPPSKLTKKPRISSQIH